MRSLSVFVDGIFSHLLHLVSPPRASHLGSAAYFLEATPTAAAAVPSAFPTSGNGLWYTKPGDGWTTSLLPIGNGYLAAMIPGGSWQETTQLNLESLWTGGPFQDPAYNGGNKQPGEAQAMSDAMAVIRQTIFESPTGQTDDVTVLTTDQGAYGTYIGAGYFLSTINDTTAASDYTRWLDLDDAVARTRWTQGNRTYLRETFCSNPTRACMQHLALTSSASGAIPGLTFAWTNYTEVGLPPPNITCLDGSTFMVRGYASTPGMLYELLGRVQASGGASKVACTAATSWGGAGANATLTVSGAFEVVFTWVGGTEYNMDAGDAAHNFSFRGNDPHDELLALLHEATQTRSYEGYWSQHTSDIRSTLALFTLDLDALSTANLSAPTDELVASYATDIGSPYLEWVAFNYGRYLLASSSRGVLPANLQGKWALDTNTPWSGDYHANINLQMNYWSAEMSDLDVTQPLWDYIQKTWQPRGEYTANVLYNISRGWVTHQEMNIFGHTGMKSSSNSAEWADYPESNAWMAIHIWDHFDYTNDIGWWKAQGWPLLKSIAAFHLDKLTSDLHFNDSSLVVAPCNSPEQVPITLACSHAQQLIWQLFNAIEKGFETSGDTDIRFLNEVREKRSTLDKGIHVGRWGQLQEWKVDLDSPSDTHRHLSHLVGLYPGYAISGYDTALQGEVIVNGTSLNYTKAEVLEAATTSLLHRGNGTGPDADSGWEKVWRAAAWAQLGDADMFYHELTYTLAGNFAPNLLSLYSKFVDAPVFQIDANLGYPAAALNALLQSPDVPNYTTPMSIVLLPALPAAWPKGSLRGARTRGGIKVDLEWEHGKATFVRFEVEKAVRARPVQVIYNAQVIKTFNSGAKQSITVHF